MTTGWPYDAGASEIGDRPGERLPKRAAGQGQPRFETLTAPVNVTAPRATTTARAGTLPGEQAVPDQPRPVQYWARQASAKPCWMCGIRLSAEQMVADDGSACPDLRWYCRDTRACTERWTSRPARPATIGEGAAETPETPGEQATGADAARPVPVIGVAF
jgi:hypothetical protein